MISHFLLNKKQTSALFALLAIFTLAHAESIAMQEGVTYANHLYQQNGRIYYKFDIGASVPQNEDLVVIAVPTHLGADPDVYISTTNPEPQNPQTSEFACSSFGYDICVLPSEKVKPNSTVYIAVYCMFWCDFEVTVQFSKVLEVTAPDDVPVYLDKTGFKQIKVKVPLSSETDHLFFEVNYKDFKNAKTMLNLFLNRGETDPSSSSFSLSGVPAWNEGTVIPIAKDNGQFCLNCTYSILVHGEPNSVLQFKAQISHEMYDIKLNARYDETLGYNGTLYYRLELSDETLAALKNQTLNFELIPYLGNPDLYINPGQKPASLSGYKWVSDTSVGESLTITPAERNLSNSVYHIAVHSVRSATFSLIAYASSKNGKKISFGMSETGYIEPSEIVNFFLDVPTDEDDLKIDASLHTVFGSTALFIKKCFPQTALCEITSDDINAARSGLAPEIYSSWQLSADNKVRFLHNSSACQASASKTCRYVAAVASTRNVTSQYQLVIYYQEKHIILRDRVPVKNTMELGEEAHYRFTLPDDQYVAAMVFQITPISGIPQLYSSKTLLYPTVTEFQKAACGCSHMIVYCGRSQLDIPLKSTYYLTVHAFTHTAYTITAYIMAWGMKAVLELHQSQPQKYAFRNNTEPAYFKFSIPSSELSHEKIRISLTPINGKYKMYLGQEFIPDPHVQQSYFTSTDSNTLILSPQSLEILKSNNFYVTVVPQQAPADADEASSKLQFTILYTPQLGLIRLQEGHPQEIKLAKNEPQYYQYNTKDSDELLRFTATVFSGDISIYISCKENYPSRTSYDLITNKSSLYSIEAETSQLLKVCSTNGSHVLPLFIGIYPENNEDAQITFSVVKNKTVNSVQDGIPLDFFPKSGKPLHFYAYSNDEPFLVIIESDYPLQIYAAIINMSATPAVVDWNFPDSTNSVALERTLGGKYSALVNPQGCKECILGITIMAEVQSAIQPKGTLLITTHARKLQSGISFVDSVRGVSYKYYNFELTNSSLSASIYLTPLGSCTPVLYLTQGRSILPAQNNYSWFSNDTVAPSIILNPQQLPKGIQSAEGYYNLAVYNERNAECTYSLMFSSQNVKFLGLKAGIPQELDLLPGQSDIYLTFVDRSSQSIKILVARDLGESNLFGKVLVNNANRSVALPNENDNEFNTKSIYTKDFIHIPKINVNFGLVEYIINVQNAEKASQAKLSVIVSAEGFFTQLYPGKTYRDFVNRSSTNSYAYAHGNLKEEEIELTLTVYSGEPTLIASTSADITSSNYQWKETSVATKASAGPKVISMRMSRGSNKDSDIKENDSLYFLVTSDSSSYYDVTLKAANRYTVLQAGKFVEGTLFPRKSQTFSFLTPNELPLDGDKFFTLSIISLSENSRPPTLKVQYSESTNKDAQETLVVPDFEKVVGNVRSLNLPRKKGAYKFIVMNTEDLKIKYSLIFNYKNEVYLPLNTPVYDTVTESKTQYYRIYIERQGQLQLEIYHCYGQVKFQIERENHTDSSRSTTGQFQSPPPSDRYSYQSYPVEEGYYTAKIKARETEEINRAGHSLANEAGYKISAMFLDSSVKVPHEFVFAGGEGILKYNFQDTNVEFEWSNIVMGDASLKAFNKSNKQEFEFAQKLVVSDSLLHLNMFAKCGMTSFAEFNVTEHPIFFMKELLSNGSDPILHASMPINSTSSVIYATVIGAVGPNFGGAYKDYHTPVPVFYKTISIQSTQVSRFNAKPIGILIGVTLTVLIVLLICLKLIRSKLIKTERKLHFEMTNAREAYDQVGEVSHADSNISVSVQNNSSYDKAQRT